MTGDIKMNIEKEQAKNCIFISFLRTRNEEKSGSTVVDGKFVKLLFHIKPTLPSAMTLQILEETIILLVLCNSTLAPPNGWYTVSGKKVPIYYLL